MKSFYLPSSPFRVLLALDSGMTPCLMYLRRSWPEALAILRRVHEAVDHLMIIAAVLVHRLNPVQIENVRIASEVAEVLHYNKRFVVELVVTFGALHESAQHLRSRHLTTA